MPARESGALRIAAVAPNWLGDAVMCLPALRVLAGAPGTSVSILAGPYTARAFMHQPGFDDVWVDAPSGRLARSRVRRVIIVGNDHVSGIIAAEEKDTDESFVIGLRGRINETEFPDRKRRGASTPSTSRVPGHRGDP